MAGGKPRNQANAERGVESVSERVLRECHSLYADPGTGLIDIGVKLGIHLLQPRKKINVMLMGNHSAGKSSFINWYVEEHIQRTGVAIETQGFTFVTSGRKRESLTGNATMHLYPQFKPLQQIEGVVEYLTTEISTSKQKKFSLVTFIDTPGLVDGDMKYPFDVDRAILWLGELCDLVLVFFDPMGQALCKRTLNIVENLSETQGEKIRFYLSKADEAGPESDRQRVMMQIVQEICKRPVLNRCGFEMQTIYIPTANKSSRCVNQIEELCGTIEKTINLTVQNTLNQLDRDCRLITSSVDTRLQEDSLRSAQNQKARSKSCLFGFLGLMIPTFLMVTLVSRHLPREVISTVLGDNGTQMLEVYMGPVATLCSLVPSNLTLYAFLTVALLSVALLMVARLSFRTQQTLSRKQKRHLLDRQEYVREVVNMKKRDLYAEYLRESIEDKDIL